MMTSMKRQPYKLEIKYQNVHINYADHLDCSDDIGLETKFWLT